jgi:hypothetical protein
MSHSSQSPLLTTSDCEFWLLVGSKWEDWIVSTISGVSFGLPTLIPMSKHFLSRRCVIKMPFDLWAKKFTAKSLKNHTLLYLGIAEMIEHLFNHLGLSWLNDQSFNHNSLTLRTFALEARLEVLWLLWCQDQELMTYEHQPASTMTLWFLLCLINAHHQITAMLILLIHWGTYT